MMTFPCPTPLIMPTKPSTFIGTAPLQALCKIAQESLGLTRCLWPTLGTTQAHHNNHYLRHPHTSSVQSCTKLGTLSRRTKTANRNDQSLACAKLHTHRHNSLAVQNCTDTDPTLGLCKIAQKLSGLPSPWVTKSRESEQGSLAALSHFWDPARLIEAALYHERIRAIGGAP